MKTSIRPWPAAFRLTAAFGALMALSACGVVELMASGISDGTKYVIRKAEQSRQEESPAPGMVPASGPASPASGSVPAANPMPGDGMGGYGSAPPAATAAPVMPVSRGTPL